ncbi:SEC-C metal-binding domain-containing protein [Alteromonas gracilis]|uniref:SEC-C metal-binding domain-containing protein n=1 Tax=Alteromonas gracilis TaxID=1479524 RepID=UPI003736C20A
MMIELTNIEDTRKPVIGQILEELERKKKEAASSGNEKLANDCWRESEAIKANVLFIKAFDKIKSKKYRGAWNDLERCEAYAASIERNSDSDFYTKSRCHFIAKQTAKWQALFPYCLFASPGFTVGHYTCSICDHKVRPRSRCSHIKGKIYNGELCLHVAHDIEFLEISIVTKPVQKYSVVHNDETLDFSLINYLSDFLDNAFENWEAHWTRKSFPIKRFSKVARNSGCPCKSGRKFKECCFNEKEISIPHVDFQFFKELSDVKAKARFPY